MKKDHFWNLGGNSVQLQCQIILLHKLKKRIFLDHLKKRSKKKVIYNCVFVKTIPLMLCQPEKLVINIQK